MNKKSIWIIIAIVVLVIGGWVWKNKAPMAQNGNEPIKIGVAVAQTGMAGYIGPEEARIVEMLINKVNKEGGVDGRQIKLIVEDTKSTAVGTTNAVSKLATLDKVPVIIGPTFGDSFQGGIPIIEKNNVTMVMVSATMETISDRDEYTHLFDAWWPSLAEIQTLQAYIAKKNLKRIAIVADKDAFALFISDFFTSNMKESGLELATRIEIPIGQNDFRTTIMSLKSKSPDAIFPNFQDPGQFGPFIKQALDLGLNVPVFGTSGSPSDVLLKDYATLMEGRFFFSSPKIDETPLYDSVVKMYKDTYGVPPTIPNLANVYNATMSIVETLRAGARTGDEIRDALYKVKTPGLGVEYVTFNKERQVNDSRFQIKTIKNSQFVVVE